MNHFSASRAYHGSGDENTHPVFPDESHKPIKPDPDTPYQPTEPAEPDIQPEIIGDH